jgi:hypothetical protein
LVLLFLETIPETERTSLLTLYNVANSLALAVGSLIGAAILNGIGISVTAYLWVFAASTAGRVLTLIPLRRVPKFSIEADEAVLIAGSSPAPLDNPVHSAVPD